MTTPDPAAALSEALELAIHRCEILANPSAPVIADDLRAAAKTHIPALLAEIARLREAVEPFVEYGRYLAQTRPYSEKPDGHTIYGTLTYGDFRRAALARPEPGQEGR